MTYGVYVGKSRTRGRVVYRSERLSEAIEKANRKHQYWPWVWIQVMA